MKNNLRIKLLGAACGLILLCAANGFAQVRVGGYKSVPADDAAVVAAADFAATTQGERDKQTISIESIEKAERQIVAGSNYKICMQVAVSEEDEDEEPSMQFVQTVVFYSLKKEYELKSWTKIADCK